jgi:hypothetical protein
VFIKIIFNLLNVLLILLLSFSLIIYLSLNIVDWPYPDESFQFGMVKNYGLIKSVFLNWYAISLGRPSATGWIDFWMWLAQVADINSIFTFLLYRIITFLFMFIGILYLVSFFLNKLSFSFRLIIALLFFNVSTISLGSYHLLQTYGLDLALYGIPFFYTILFIIFSFKILDRNSFTKFNIFLYYLSLVLFVNSSYAHLVTGGLLLYFGLFTKNEVHAHIGSPFKYLYEIFYLNFKKNLLFFFKNNKFINKNNIFVFGLYIYIVCAVINLISPSIIVRENIWPSDTSVLLGFYNSLPVLEGLIIYEWSIPYLMLTVLVIIASSTIQVDFNKYSIYLRLLLIFIAPITVFFTNALAFKSSSLQFGLWLGWWNSTSNYWENSLFFFNSVNEYFNYKFGTSARHIFYFNNIALISYFFLGLQIGSYFKKNN